MGGIAKKAGLKRESQYKALGETEATRKATLGVYSRNAVNSGRMIPGNNQRRRRFYPIIASSLAASPDVMVAPALVKVCRRAS